MLDCSASLSLCLSVSGSVSPCLPWPTTHLVLCRLQQRCDLINGRGRDVLQPPQIRERKKGGGGGEQTRKKQKKQRNNHHQHRWVRRQQPFTPPPLRFESHTHTRTHLPLAPANLDSGQQPLLQCAELCRLLVQRREHRLPRVSNLCQVVQCKQAGARVECK